MGRVPLHRGQAAQRDPPLRQVGQAAAPGLVHFPRWSPRLAGLDADDFVLDGELTIPVGHSLSFEALQLRLHPAESRIRKLAAETPSLLIAFDLLAEAGRPLAERPFRDRRCRPRGRPSCSKTPRRAALRLSPQISDLRRARTWLSRTGPSLDGVIAKRLDLPYRPGERAMLKVKNIRTADCVVGGFRYGTGSRLVAALLLGLYDGTGRLDHVGFTSALANEDKPDLTGRLEALRGDGFTGNAPGGPSRWSTERSGEYFPMRPELVVEVSYDHVTGARFRHGTGLRRWRPDKAPRQCTYDQLHLEARPSAIIRQVLAPV